MDRNSHNSSTPAPNNFPFSIMNLTVNEQFTTVDYNKSPDDDDVTSIKSHSTQNVLNYRLGYGNRKS